CSSATLLLIEHPPFLAEKVQSREDEDEDEETEGHRGCQSHVGIVEAFDVDVPEGREQRLPRTPGGGRATGEDHQLGELLECTDESGYDVEEDGRGQEGQCDVPESGPAGSTMDGAGFIESPV